MEKRTLLRVVPETRYVLEATKVEGVPRKLTRMERIRYNKWSLLLMGTLMAILFSFPVLTHFSVPPEIRGKASSEPAAWPLNYLEGISDTGFILLVAGMWAGVMLVQIMTVGSPPTFDEIEERNRRARKAVGETE